MSTSYCLHSPAGILITFLAASIACSAILEVLAAFAGLRGMFLKATLVRMLPDLFRRRLLSHCAITALRSRSHQFPSYIDPKLFAMICYAEAIDGIDDRNGLTTKVPELEVFFKGATSSAGVIANLADWFIACTDRTSGSYRRWSQVGLFVIALLMSAILGMDALKAMSSLCYHADQRERPVLGGLPTVAGGESSASLSAHGYDAGSLGIGEALAALAITFGATVWFDASRNVLLLNPRYTGPPPPGFRAIRY